MTEFATVRIRVAGLVHHDGEVALIRRDRAGGILHTLPGGNVDPGEDLMAALARELAEELHLHLPPSRVPALVGVQDQRVTRPGPDPSPRKLHLIFDVPISDTERDQTATVEHDEHGTGDIVWLSRAQATSLHLYPAAAALLESAEGGPAPTMLAAMTDDTYQWR